MGSGQVADAHQEFVDDLAACKSEGFFKQRDPLFFGLWVMMLQPFFKGTMRLLKFKNGFGIFYGSIYFQLVSDNSRIRQQPFPVCLGVGSDFLNVKIAVSIAEGSFFL